MTDNKPDAKELDIEELSKRLKSFKSQTRKAKKKLKQLEVKFNALSVESTRKMIRERLSGRYHDDMWATCTCFEEKRSMEDGDVCNTCWEAQHQE